MCGKASIYRDVTQARDCFLSKRDAVVCSMLGNGMLGADSLPRGCVVALGSVNMPRGLRDITVTVVIPLQVFLTVKIRCGVGRKRTTRWPCGGPPSGPSCTRTITLQRTNGLVAIHLVVKGFPGLSRNQSWYQCVTTASMVKTSQGVNLDQTECEHSHHQQQSSDGIAIANLRTSVEICCRYLIKTNLRYLFARA